jgi:predicted nucleic acid-binding Zn ribbon protein
MPLRDRHCKKCEYIEIDRVEKMDAGVMIECPECHDPSFEILFTCPAVIVMKGEGTSALEFCTELDNRRANAAAGHGNTTLQDSSVGVKYSR